MNHEKSPLITDLDGTLFKTLPLVYHGQHEAARRYLADHEHIPNEHIPPYETYAELLDKAIGGSTLETFQTTLDLAFRDTYPHYLNLIDAREPNALLQVIQDELAPDYVSAYDDVSELLDWLGQNGHDVAFFTSGSAHHVVRNGGQALPELGLQDLFKDKTLSDIEKLARFAKALKTQYSLARIAIITCDDVTATKPDPEGLLKAAADLQHPVQECVMLGDDIGDMAAAKAAGVSRRVGIIHGARDATTLRKAGATHIIENALDIRPIMEQQR